jgi:putative ABC transport system permease protein
MWIELIGHDLRFAARQMKRSPGFTAVALVAIAVGIGANSAVFSFFNAIYLRTSPVADADRLVALHRVDQRGTGAREILTVAQYDYLRQHATAFTGLAAQNWSWAWLSHGERSVELQGGQVSANYFDVLSVAPHLGGFFSGTNHPSSVVLSYRTWISTFDGDPTVVGRTVRLNQRPFTVVGVAPKDFGGIYLGESFGLWMLAANPDGVVVAKLQPGASPERARAELAALDGQLAANAGQNDRYSRVILESLRGLHPNVREALGVFPSLLAAATICLLTIACANVAGLLLARADSRRKEMAVRLSLGASRRRLVQQLLTETILLSGVGGLLGLWLAVAGCRLLEQFFGYQIPDMRLALDWRVVTMSAVLSVTTGIIFGMVPAWHTTRPDVAVAMRERSYAGLSAIAVQTALCAVLLIGAGLLFQSMRAVMVRPGINPDDVAHFRVRARRIGYSLERARSYQRELLRRVEAVPGVERAVVARVPPERGWCCDVDVARPGEDPIKVPQNEVSPGFLPAMAIPILDGRDFVDGDRNVVIVNQMLVEKLWPKQSALDREIWINREPHRVIGIAANIHAVQPGERAYPYVYLPIWGRDARDARLFVRVSGRAAAILEQLRRVVVSVDPDVHVGQESTLAGRTEMSYQRERLLAGMLEFTGGVALLLGAIGLYGLVSYQVSRRAREIGIRMALGAQRRQLIAWIIRRGLFAACVGLGAGALIAWQAAPVLSAFLYGVGPADALTFGAVIAVLGIVALTASFLPARRVSRLDPAVALRDQ